MESSPLCSPLLGELYANVTTDVNVNVQLQGFLTIGKENTANCIMWNRRWCVLSNGRIQFWNYPSDSEDKDPLDTIALKLPNRLLVKTADRSICPKPRTLQLEIEVASLDSENDRTVKRLFLSADTTDEKRNWEACLNLVVSSSKKWICINI